MKYVFLKWWLLLCVTLASGAYVYNLGFFAKLWALDQSKMSFVALSLYIVISLYIGYQTWRVSRKNRTDQDLHKTVISLPGFWFSSEAMMIFGMIGTVIGFILALKPASSNFDVGQAAVIAQMAGGMATSCLATLCGLLTMVLTRVQLVSLEYFLNDEQTDEETADNR
jgi:hypothetical protein